MPVDPGAWTTALLFGLLLGWSVSRSPEDRAMGTRAVLVLVLVGTIAWALGPEPGSDHAMAAVSMTLAGLSALAVAVAVNLRSRAR